MTDLHLERWSPELRRALMKTKPEFFTWSVAQRERYGIAIPKEDRARIEQALLEALFGNALRSPEEAAQEVERLPIAQKNRWNEIILPLVGIGEDSFFLNELSAENKTILDFGTVRAYDEDDHRFQERARQDARADYVGQPYRGALYLTWARLFVDGQFTYATLSMAAGYVYAQLSDASSDLIKARVPYRLVPGKNHGKTAGDNWQWDMRVAANGQEAIVEELQQRVFAYEAARHEALQRGWDEAGRQGAYLVDSTESPERHLHVVFTDKDALTGVRFPSFMRDCRAIARPATELQQAVAEEQCKLAAFIEEQHADIVKNLDPKVTRLRQRWRIMVHKDALADLSPGLDEED